MVDFATTISSHLEWTGPQWYIIGEVKQKWDVWTHIWGLFE